MSESQNITENEWSKENPPKIEYIENNRGNNDILCENNIYQLKSSGKLNALFRCRQCCASISLATCPETVENKVKYVVKEPFEVKNLNIKHKTTCTAKKDDAYLNNRKLVHEVRKEILLNPLTSLQQAFEARTSREVYSK